MVFPNNHSAESRLPHSGDLAEEDFGLPVEHTPEWEIGKLVKNHKRTFLALLAAGSLATSGLLIRSTNTTEADAISFAGNPANTLDLQSLFRKSPAQLREEAKKGGKSSARYYACCQFLGELELLSPEQLQEKLAKSGGDQAWFYPYTTNWILSRPR